jgi:hypothetical protein
MTSNNDTYSIHFSANPQLLHHVILCAMDRTVVNIKSEICDIKTLRLTRDSVMLDVGIYTNRKQME